MNQDFIQKVIELKMKKPEDWHIISQMEQNKINNHNNAIDKVLQLIENYYGNHN